MRFRLFLATLVIFIFATGAQDKDQKIEPPDLSTYAGLSSALQAKQRNLLVLDVRSRSDYLSGFIPTAINIPVSSLLRSEPSRNRNITLVVYGWSRASAERAVDMLKNMDYNHVILFGSVHNWTGVLSGVKK